MFQLLSLVNALQTLAHSSGSGDNRAAQEIELWQRELATASDGSQQPLPENPEPTGLVPIDKMRTEAPFLSMPNNEPAAGDLQLLLAAQFAKQQRIGPHALPADPIEKEPVRLPEPPVGELPKILPVITDLKQAIRKIAGTDEGQELIRRLHSRYLELQDALRSGVDPVAPATEEPLPVSAPIAETGPEGEADVDVDLDAGIKIAIDASRPEPAEKPPVPAVSVAPQPAPQPTPQPAAEPPATPEVVADFASPEMLEPIAETEAEARVAAPAATDTEAAAPQPPTASAPVVQAPVETEAAAEPAADDEAPVTVRRTPEATAETETEVDADVETTTSRAGTDTDPEPEAEVEAEVETESPARSRPAPETGDRREAAEREPSRAERTRPVEVRADEGATREVPRAPAAEGAPAARTRPEAPPLTPSPPAPTASVADRPQAAVEPVRAAVEPEVPAPTASVADRPQATVEPVRAAVEPEVPARTENAVVESVPETERPQQASSTEPRLDVRVGATEVVAAPSSSQSGGSGQTGSETPQQGGPGTASVSGPQASNPASAAEPPRIPHQALAEAIVSRARLLPQNGAVELRFALEPEDLGPVRVRIESRGEQLKIRIIASSSIAADTLNTGLARLSAQLSDAGIQDADIDLGFEQWLDDQPRDQARDDMSDAPMETPAIAPVAMPADSAPEPNPFANEVRLDRTA